MIIKNYDKYIYHRANKQLTCRKKFLYFRQLNEAGKLKAFPTISLDKINSYIASIPVDV